MCAYRVKCLKKSQGKQKIHINLFYRQDCNGVTITFNWIAKPIGRFQELFLLSTLYPINLTFLFSGFANKKKTNSFTSESKRQSLL